MAIQVDNRAGSVKLIPYLRGLGCEVESGIFPFGDASFIGYGANGDPCSIGVEVKSLEDLAACVISGRFSGHQLPGLIKSYDYVWLLLIGEWRPRQRDGVLEYKKEGRGGGQYWTELSGGRRTWFWRDIQSYLTTCEVMGGIRVHSVSDYAAAALWLKTLASWFARDNHKSHKTVYGTKELFSDRALLIKPTLARRVAAQLPGVAEVRSAAVADKFRTIEAMANATEKDWRSVDGLGKETAKKIFNIIHGLNGSKGH